MIYGLYTAAAGMLAQQTATDANANNLANASTAGYRRQLASVSAFSHAVQSQWDAKTPGSESQPTTMLSTTLSTDASFGTLRQTENPTDFALRGDGFFLLQSPNGGQALTRNGAFTLNSNGQLATADGWLVMGERGPISIDSAKWEVDSSGQVMVDGQSVDRLRIVAPANPDRAVRVGDTRWAATNLQTMRNVQIEQGCLENSNVNVVSEMISLISATRTFEASQRCVQALDSTLDRAVNEVGRTA